VDAERADILCLQETKVNAESSNCVDSREYPHRYWSFEEKKGYGGTAVFSKHKPLAANYGIEGRYKGRVIMLEFDLFYLVACYVPNAGEKLVRLGERIEFNRVMKAYLRELEGKGKGVIWAGDLNVAHTAKDLARPKTNEKTAGFTPEERADFTDTLGSNLSSPLMIDAWRHLHPDTTGQYSYYSYRFQCRSKGIGWRLDYFVLSASLLKRLRACDIRLECYGASDHLPVACVIEVD
jgi:AP endonuclease-1